MNLVSIAGHGSRLTAAAASALYVEASTRALEMTFPMQVAAAGTGLNTNSRCFRAYTGVTYEIPLMGIFGSWPFTWSLSNAPAGMTVEQYTNAAGTTSHLIRWVNPTSTASDIVITCTDSEDTEAAQTFSVTVGTSGFVFVDAVDGDDSGAGTFADPWQTLDKVNTSGSATDIAYFMTGTYTLAGITVTNADDANGEERISWAGPMIWLNYPGETPELDFEYAGTGEPYNTGDSVPRIRSSSEYVFMDGFTFTDAMTMAFQLNSSNQRGQIFWRCVFDGVGPGITGGNSGFLMWVRSPDAPRLNVGIISCTFRNIQYGTGNCALKIYDSRKMLVEGCNFEADSGGAEAPLAIKGGVEEIEVQANKFAVTTYLAIGGNMAGNDTDPVELSSGEIRFNKVLGNTSETTAGRGCLLINDHADAFGPFDVIRNTFVGLVTLSSIDTGDGPVLFRHNVKINSSSGQTPWAHIVDSAVTDSSVVTITDDLNGVAADGIVDVNGDLQGAYLTANGPTTAAPRGCAYA